MTIPEQCTPYVEMMASHMDWPGAFAVAAIAFAIVGTFFAIAWGSK